MSKVTVIGMVTQVGKTEVFGENGFKKRELIIKTIEEYPNFFLVEFVQGNVDLLNGIEVGSNLKISANLNGREYTKDEGKYMVFMSLRGWKIESV